MQISKNLVYGTHGRTWYTDESNNIAFSFYIETKCSISQLNGLTIEIANIIIKTFRILYKIELDLKSPNDIVLKNKKIGGILTETKLKGSSVQYIVIGIGINTNKENFIPQIENIATSIKKEFNIIIDNTKIIKKFCELFEKEVIERSIV